MQKPATDLGLSSQASLILASIAEPSNNDLRLVVIEARVQTATVQTGLGPAQPVIADASSRALEFTWWKYVAYAVGNESYSKHEQGEPSSGGRFGTRRDSAFLAYVSASTFATDEFPGPLLHWFLETEWHCIDVISDSAPDIRELAAEELAVTLAAMDAKS